MELRDGKNPLLDQIRRMAALQQFRQMPDRELLAQFAGQGNEAAFRAVMDRYGPMVLRVCKRVLGNDHDAEDAYQATFLILASKAGSQPWQESVAAWLHGVAVRVAREARRAAQRRQVHEHQTPEKKTTDPLADLSMREAYGLLDEELARLPEKYRAPLIQCQLMDRRQDEVARELGCSVRAIKHRLEQGKGLLKKRLAARGVTLTGLLLSLMLSPGSEAAAVPSVLAADTLRAVVLFATGREAMAASPAATHLAGIALKGILIAQVRTRVMGVVLALVLAGAGLGAWQVCIHWPDPANPSAAPLPANEVPAARNPTPVAGGKVAGPETPAQTDGPTAFVRGKVLNAAGCPVPFAAVTVLVRRPFRPGEHGLRDQALARCQADEHGAFRLGVPADFPTWFPHRQVALLAAAPGHSPTTAIVPLVEHDPSEVTLRLAAASDAVHGRLMTPNGTAASGVQLRVVRLGDVTREPVQGADKHDAQEANWPAPLVSDADGRFELVGIDLAKGAWLQVDDERYAPNAFKISNEEPTPTIKLKPAQVIEGRVVAADTGLPLAGVKLTARDSGSFIEYAHLLYAQLAVADYQSTSARLLPVGATDSVADNDGRFRLRLASGPMTKVENHPPPGALLCGTLSLSSLAITKVEIHPPAGTPYLAVSKDLSWPGSLLRQTLDVALPRGVVVRGRVVDEDNRPVAGASVMFVSPSQGNPEHQSEVLQGWYRVVTTGADGRFQLTAPAGPVQLRARGPTHEYRAQAVRFWGPLSNEAGPQRWGWREPIPQVTLTGPTLPSDRRVYTHAEEDLGLRGPWLSPMLSRRRVYTHAEEDLELSPAGPPVEVQLRLVRGKTLAGEVVGPEGQAVTSAVLLCGEKVSPLVNRSAVPLPVRGGRYELPGCVPGRVYPTMFLDAVHGWGAVVDLPNGRGEAPEVKLSRCGSARVRLVDGRGRPLASRVLGLWLLTERSFPAGNAPGEREWEVHLASWYDPLNYADLPRSDAQGWLKLPALIPGAQYHLCNLQTDQHYQSFAVKEGECKQLPDIMMSAERHEFSDGN